MRRAASTDVRFQTARTAVAILLSVSCICLLAAITAFGIFTRRSYGGVAKRALSQKLFSKPVRGCKPKPAELIQGAEIDGEQSARQTVVTQGKKWHLAVRFLQILTI
jgi:hypothetical protein